MYEVTEEWLEKINNKFIDNDIPHKRRPWDAWGEWSKHIGLSTSLDNHNVKKIFEWFEKNTKPGSHYFDPMFIGAFYYDACFWSIPIPTVIGRMEINPIDSLKKIPDTIRLRLIKSKEQMSDFINYWCDCVDYSYGISDIQAKRGNSLFWQKLLTSCELHIKSTISLLLEKHPNTKASENAGSAIEMILKSYIDFKRGLDEKEAKNIGHDLNKALRECLNIDSNSDLNKVIGKLDSFPNTNDRYTGHERIPRELWDSYKIAQFIAATVIREFTSRNTRKTLIIRDK